MNCAECQHNHGSCGREIVDMPKGYTIHVPCISSRIRKVRELTENGHCTAFERKTSPVDPTLTRDSTCGECGHCKSANVAVAYYFLTKDSKPTGDETACCKFQAKPTRLKASDCPAFTAIDHGDLGTCAKREGARCHGDGDACEEMQGGAP